MHANHFVALSFITALVSVNVVNSIHDTLQTIYVSKPTNVLNKDKVTEELHNLIKCEMDDSLILSQAIKTVKDPVVKKQLLKFKHGCEWRIKELELVFHQLGLTIPRRTKDATSYLMQGFVAIRGLTGDKGVLKALRLNEKIVLSTYEQALKNNLPANIRIIVQDIYENTKRHVQYVEDRLNIKAI